jgi:ATP synthase I subunit
MTPPAPWDMERALARIYRIMIGLAVFGTAAGLALRGWRWAFGFLVGAAASYVNFRWLKQIVDAVGGEPASRPGRARAALLMGLRFFLLWGGAYVIVKYSSLALAGALMGLFVPAAAAILEIVFELAYARSS